MLWKSTEFILESFEGPGCDTINANTKKQNSQVT